MDPIVIVNTWTDEFLDLMVSKSAARRKWIAKKQEEAQENAERETPMRDLKGLG